MFVENWSHVRLYPAGKQALLSLQLQPAAEPATIAEDLVTRFGHLRPAVLVVLTPSALRNVVEDNIQDHLTQQQS